ncbi:MAG: hypothetical protein QMB51_01185 [Patescibacteria group bacterium]
MKRLQIIFCSFIFAFVSILPISFVNAEESINTYIDPIGSQMSFDPNSSSMETAASTLIGQIASNFINRLFGIIGIIVLCLFVWAGLQYILARGSSEKVKKANGVMKWSVIGLLIVFSSYIIINFMFTVIKKLSAES